MRKRRLSEDAAGIYTHPDSMDPNDRLRQRTQARAGEYPYDMPTSYGQPIGTDSGGAAYQKPPTTEPPVPRSRKASDWKPKDPWNLAKEMAEGTLDPYEPGPQADDALRLGYGNHGRMGDGVDPQELDMDALRNDFRDSFITSLPVVQGMGSKGLFALLMDLDPEYSAELFAPDDDGEMLDVYNHWGRHVYAPGAEEDPEQL